MLHIKSRPKKLEEIFGNESVVESLEGLIEKENCPHVFLFHGETGCGKTTFARILAEELGGVGDDIFEINMSNNRGIDTARGIIGNLEYVPMLGSSSIYILDEFHKATPEFQNAVLKVFEDTPDHVYFILCTTEPSKIIKTIKNRAMIFEVEKLSPNTMFQLLAKVAKKEKIKITDANLKKIIKASKGIPRQALVFLNQIEEIEDEEKIDKILKNIDKEKEEIITLCRKLLSATEKNWNSVAELIIKIEDEPEKVRRAVVGYMTQVLLKKNEPRAAYVLECFQKPFFDNGKGDLTLACYYSIGNE